jgi:hypothetical protein
LAALKLDDLAFAKAAIVPIPSRRNPLTRKTVNASDARVAPGIGTPPSQSRTGRRSAPVVTPRGNRLILLFERPIAMSDQSKLRDNRSYFTEYLVNAPPACVSEFGPSAA